MDNKAAEILERIIFNESEKDLMSRISKTQDNVKRVLKSSSRALKGSQKELDRSDRREKNIKRAAIGAGVVAAGAGLYAWRQHRKKKAEEEAKKNEVAEMIEVNEDWRSFINKAGKKTKQLAQKTNSSIKRSLPGKLINKTGKKTRQLVKKAEKSFKGHYFGK